MTVFHRLILTVAYSQVFDYPLKDTELRDRLIIDRRCNSSLDSNRFHKVAENTCLIRQNGYWGLGSSSHLASQISDRRKRERISQKKLAEFQPVVQMCRWLPWVRGMAVTGSVSMDNAQEKDDVDVMIVCRLGRLWLTRPLIVLFSFIYGKRRSWNHEEENSWCFNLWLEEDSLAVPPAHRSIYTAYEVCQARWLVSKNQIDRTFLWQNYWVREWLPLFFRAVQKENSQRIQQTVARWSPLSDMFDILNRAAYQIQRWYMDRHMTREKVSYKSAFFHPRDTKGQIFKQWKRQLQNLKSRSS